MVWPADASLIETDGLRVGDAATSSSRYSSPQASPPYTISSRYEWGVDTLNGKVIYPEEQDLGRTTKGTSEFRLRLRPDNLGVLLRRKLDYSFPNQRAEVYIADTPSAGKPAGIWYLAVRIPWSSPTRKKNWERRNTRSRPRTASSATTSFSFPPKLLTRGRKSIRVRIKFTPGQPAALSRLSHRRSRLE